MCLLFSPPRLTRVRRDATGVYLTALAAAATLIFATTGSAQDKPGAPPPPAQAAAPAAAPDNKPAEYIGSEMCAACHEDISKAFAKNPHHIVETDKRRGFDTKACESCHRPASKHADSM